MLATELFGNKLKELRMEKGLSQRQLAELMMVSNSAIANWEVGKRLPDLAMLTRLAECLDVEPYLLLDELRQPGEVPNIILVEDAPIILRGLIRTVREELPEAEVRGFRTGAEALAYARENLVSVAFLDIELSGENGIELSRRLKEINGRTNVIFLTCHTEYTQEAIHNHCSGYIIKPLTPEKLHRELDNLRFPVRGLKQ
ncbi:MAG: response regulator [Oscillospiraceae bacterium]|nr:response regulator [Oscillospiraceae bacterium]